MISFHFVFHVLCIFINFDIVSFRISCFVYIYLNVDKHTVLGQSTFLVQQGRLHVGDWWLRLRQHKRTDTDTFITLKNIIQYVAKINMTYT